MSWPRRTLIVASLLLSLWGGLILTTTSATAEVIKGIGFEATVAGWTSWYGSYVLADHGQVWCIDHGLRAPDGDFGYRPSAAPGIPVADQAAMAWALGTFGNNPSAVDAAALMLVMHDFNAAMYPQGRLDVDRLARSQLAGFHGAEAQVLDQARAMKAAARNQSRSSDLLAIELDVVIGDIHDPEVSVMVQVLDGARVGIANTDVELSAVGGTLGRHTITTGTDGIASTTLTRGESPTVISAIATSPAFVLGVFGPSGAAAQRVAVPTRQELSARLSVAPPTPVPSTTTTSTSTTSTSTTIPATTTTVSAAPTTSLPEAPSTTTTTLPSTTTTTEPPFSTTTTTPPPNPTTTTEPTVVPPFTSGPSPSGAPSAPARAPAPSSRASVSLPATGAATRGLVLLAGGLVCLGSSIMLTGRPRQRS